ncbi:hypothetical protein E8E13_006212 [Curvularia kusanoi]|uniref:Uncharacterized protein n=1 Tax=Curvularia kusanoi TaxID=90978 RepID=A0A9P4TBL9_CURKU|nr:hypothetical protein E8E13_006212 [Curvularia kusanoi]
MAWWRHDPSIWARSPGHRYAERIIRDHEAVLRTRCFSLHEDEFRSQTKAATSEQASAQRPTSFAQPGVRTKHYERDEVGIVSPSDLRRPWEEVMSGGAKAPDLSETHDHELGDNKSWRQTSLQRRSAPGTETGSRTDSLSTTNPDVSAQATNNPVTFTIPSSQALVDNYPYPKLVAKSHVKGDAIEEAPRGFLENSKSEGVVYENNATRADTQADTHPAGTSISAKLRSLPDNDIDFLSAEEIRASMGRKHRTSTSGEDKELERQKLEVDYITAKPKALDEAVEGQVLNNYYVRRTQQELERANPATQDTQQDGVQADQSPSVLQPESVELESSIDRMKRWIEEGGVSLAKHFWQDPIEPGAPSEADMQFFKQLAGLAKARRARELISDDLETDLPMCKGLLERLKNDENKVDHVALRLRTPQKVVHGAEMTKNLRTIRERRLRNTYERIEKQLQAACQLLRDLDPETIRKSTTWGAQARLDKPGIEKSKAECYGELLSSLATLRDTQLALARLLDHAIQTYGVSFKPADEALSKSILASEPGVSSASTELDSALLQTAGTKFLAQTAAEAYLTDEVQSQKAAMEGLSDDGYARESKPSPLRLLEEKGPLADSLFRPFASQLENLGNKASKEQVVGAREEKQEQETQDQALVREVRTAYEDVYGPITNDHRQVPQVEEGLQLENPIPSATLKVDQKHLQDVAVNEGINIASAAELQGKDVAESSIENAQLESADIALPTADVGITAKNSPLDNTAAEVMKDHSQERSPNDERTAAMPHTVTTETGERTTANSALSMQYTILIYDPRTEKMSITTSKSESSHGSSAAVPIHQALSSLKEPARFIPYITPGLEIVSVRKNMLVLRDALDKESSIRGFETISTHSSIKTNADPVSGQTNPIDGTPRLSPTGYSGVERTREENGAECEGRRQESAAIEGKAWNERSRQHSKEEVPGRGKGGVSSVLKAAIWASAACYVIGVTAEVFR